MAGCTEHLSDVLGTLSINNGQLDENQRTQLKENIENNYESIFSWDIQQLTGGNKNHKFNLIDKIREELEMIIDKDNEYNLNRFYLQLIVSYELYISKSYNESYKEIENIVKFMKKCKFDESNKYSDAYYHIAQATYAYIALSLKIDSEKLLKNVKEIKSFNPEEKAAVCAVKARVFMQYSPKGNDIALKFADQAKNLDSTEPKWIVIWLKAKGRVRRYYEQFAMPENDEMDAAKILASAKTNAGLLIKASKVYLEAAFVNKLKNNREESNKYYKLSYDITKKSVELAKDDIQQLYSCLLICIEYPKELLSKSMMENLIAKLKNVKNSYVDEILGKYYLKHEKDYEEAKIHLSRGKDAGNFNSSLQLIKVECLLQPVNKFPLVQELNMMYDVFPSPQRRLIILSQILIYYNYCENNPKEMIRYLKMYIDQDIEDTFKKRHLIFAYPFFKINGFKPKQFLNVLSIKLKELVNNNKWSLEERKMIDNTFDRFNKISKLNLYDNKTTFHSKNDNKMYPSDKGKNESWRKQKIDLSSQDEFNNIHQHQFASKYVNQKNSLEKHAGRVIEPLTNQHKEIYNSFEMYPNNKNKFWRKQKVDLSSKSKELCNNSQPWN